ncbi:MAG: hypothetical protein ACOYK1_05680 [Vampirovibrionia bacterium]
MQYPLVKQQQEAVRIFQDLRKRGKGFSGLRPAEIKEKLDERRELFKKKKLEPYSTRRLLTLAHSAYREELKQTLNDLIKFAAITNSGIKPSLKLNAIIQANLKAPITGTKIKTEIPYLPSLDSAWMINNQGAFYKWLNTAFNMLEAQKENNNCFLLSSEAPDGHNDSSLITKETHRVLKNIDRMLLTAIKHLGFHEVSGAKYGALAVYGQANNNFHDFVLSSNNDPKFKDFDKPNMRRCAEDSARLLAQENQLDHKKLKYLFLMREPYPEGYGDNNNGVFNFSKLVPCKSCLQHLEKLYKDGGNLIIVASLNQGKSLEESLNQSKTDQSKPKNYLLKEKAEEEQAKDDIKIIYPQGLKHCFIEIPNRNLPRIIVEKEIGTNVRALGAQCQDSREVFTFGEWLKTQKLREEARKLLIGESDLFKQISN